MALAGDGAICIWNDIADESRDDFYAWHLNEHMPERVAIPGFRRGRRYIAFEAATQPEFFTLYETVDPAVLTGRHYLARLNAPTPWTRRVTQAFRNTARALTTVKASFGPGAGGALATLRLVVAEGREEETVGILSSDVLPAAAGRARIAGAHLCVTDRGASAARTAESRDRTDILAAPGWILLVEGCDEASVRSAAADAQARLASLVEGEVLAGFYRLEFQCAAG